MTFCIILFQGSTSSIFELLIFQGFVFELLIFVFFDRIYSYFFFSGQRCIKIDFQNCVIKFQKKFICSHFDRLFVAIPI